MKEEGFGKMLAIMFTTIFISGLLWIHFFSSRSLIVAVTSPAYWLTAIFATTITYISYRSGQRIVQSLG